MEEEIGRYTTALLEMQIISHEPLSTDVNSISASSSNTIYCYTRHITYKRVLDLYRPILYLY
jgi:hypothetical protein